MATGGVSRWRQAGIDGGREMVKGKKKKKKSWFFILKFVLGIKINFFYYYS